MKLFIILSAFSVLLLSSSDCSKKKEAIKKYKARLEIKAICMNYTLAVIEPAIDTSQVVAKWTDENTGKSYTSTFALANPCDFPADIKQGDEFYFTIDTAKQKDCIVCMAYYPTPPKKISIKVTDR